jgi:hypothetical protein
MLSNDLLIYDSQSFYECAIQNAKNTRNFVVDEKEVENKMNLLLNARWKQLKDSKGMRKQHYFVPSEDLKKIISYLTCKMEQQIVHKI